MHQVHLSSKIQALEKGICLIIASDFESCKIYNNEINMIVHRENL